MRTRWKVLLVILAAVIYWMLVQYLPAVERCEALKVWYNGYNETYFGNSLPTDTLIDYTGEGNYVAVTSRMPDGTFHIRFNAKYTQSPMFAHLILLHESCHIKTWDEVAQHGPRWGACMMTLYTSGAFSNELVNQFTERSNDD